jgi:hypothetical protein
MKSLFTLTLLFFVLAAAAQINKGQFLAGGSGTYSATTYRHTDTKFRGFEIDGRGGIFLLNKLAAGLQIGYSYNKEFGTVEITNQPFQQYDRSLSAGPFVRYYFLRAANKINLIADASYFRSWSKSGNFYGDSKWKSYGYTLAAGPVLFLNPKVSLETTLNYEYQHESFNAKALRVKLGFQVYLSKCKKNQQ